MLSSRWINEHVLEVSDGYVTMGIGNRELTDVVTFLREGTHTNFFFRSQRHTLEMHDTDRYPTGWLFALTDNMLHTDTGSGVHWRMFYAMPHLGRVRKEVLWSKAELLYELRAAEVAVRLRPRAAGYHFPY